MKLQFYLYISTRMTNLSNGPSLKDFVTSCVVNVTKLVNLNTHAVLDDTKWMMIMLLSHELKHRKYAQDTSEDDNDDDNDNDSDEQDEE